MQYFHADQGKVKNFKLCFIFIWIIQVQTGSQPGNLKATLNSPHLCEYERNKKKKKEMFVYSFKTILLIYKNKTRQKHCPLFSRNLSLLHNLCLTQGSCSRYYIIRLIFVFVILFHYHLLFFTILVEIVLHCCTCISRFFFYFFYHFDRVEQF